MPEPTIFLDQVEVRLGGVTILQDVSLSVDAGEFIVILGPNGAGKTTLLKLILRLVRPDAGTVRILGQPPRRGLPGIGYAPQRRSLDVEMGLRARDLVGFGLDGHRWGIGLSGRKRTEKINQALEEVDALELAEAPIGTLSGGEQQRLLLAQALLSDPRLLLLDEPLANLDPAHQQEAVCLVDEIRCRHGTTVLLVSHDINPLLPVTDRVIFVAHSHSAIGTPEQVITSPTLSQLYNTPVEVIQLKGRYFVVGVEV
jgi:zinc/manganese transport system ATP-binding protein